MIKRSLACVCVLTTLALGWSAPVSAQGATASISGTVVDSAGGAIPGAAVTVTNTSGASFETVSNAEGVFNVPALVAGTYKVTVALTGFKTAVIDVQVAPGTPSAVKAVLEV
ncbi:MAG TPA: carboxypeptidase-like regulatory domain-containing protein, partial [Vicinamibacterales bacterium]